MCKQNIVFIKYNCKLKKYRLFFCFFTVNSAEELVITVWEDFGDLVGGAGGANVCVCEGGLLVVDQQMDTHG